MPANTWYSVDVLEPSVLFEVKDGKYGDDGTEKLNDFKIKQWSTSLKPPSQTPLAISKRILSIL
ncbi:hypothetical protein NXW20_03295 [Bacteroides faecis]|uniref:hypothetical protein n=1 Tax=Bacteroides TaxID=816 RepID=UPI00216B1E77|nr:MULTISPECIES: hypothetical protein [Bacteroides]MCS2194714.1 hypothetical protein [Bacteroides faecis]